MAASLSLVRGEVGGEPARRRGGEGEEVVGGVGREGGVAVGVVGGGQRCGAVPVRGKLGLVLGNLEGRLVFGQGGGVRRVSRGRQRGRGGARVVVTVVVESCDQTDGVVTVHLQVFSK